MYDAIKMLNSESIDKASEDINKMLVEYYKDISDKFNALSKERESLIAIYNQANDGDAAENAPLEQAVANLKKNAAELMHTDELIGRFSKIDEGNFRMSTVESEISQMKSKIQDINRIDKEAIESILGCDIDQYSYRNMTDDALDALNTLDTKSASVIEFVNLCNDVKRASEYRVYNSTGFVSMYSTIRLGIKEPNNNAETWTLRIYPDGISALDRGVLAANSIIAKSIIGKHAGDTYNGKVSCIIKEVF